MNAHGRRLFRRLLDKMLPAGTYVQVDAEDLRGRIKLGVVKARRTVHERREHNRVLIESAKEPFGFISLHWSRLQRASPYIVNRYMESTKR